LQAIFSKHMGTRKAHAANAKGNAQQRCMFESPVKQNICFYYSRQRAPDDRRLIIYKPSVFTRESSYCFQRVLAIAILSVCPSDRPSVTRVDQSKTVQPKITKSSLSAAWKTLVSKTVKLFRKFEGGHPERGR